MDAKKQDSKQGKFNLPKPDLNSGSGKAQVLIPKMKESGLTTDEALELLEITNDKQARNLLREALVIGAKSGFEPILLRAGSTKRYCLVEKSDLSEFKKQAKSVGYIIEENLPKRVRLALKQVKA